MSESIEIRALKACRELYLANQAIKRVSEQIGSCLNSCYADFLNKNPVDKFPFITSKPHVTHLEQAYASEKDDGGRTVWLDSDEVDEVLAECPHCKRAHQLIQERKKLRMALGIAKRRVTMIGRNAA